MYCRNLVYLWALLDRSLCCSDGAFSSSLFKMVIIGNEKFLTTKMFFTILDSLEVKYKKTDF